MLVLWFTIKMSSDPTKLGDITSVIREVGNSHYL